ncbi:MAG: T9SS type A sorting domain-containing protein [Fimbriimonadaceae bacterium]|nr:T9SS type A sorting domain-containing protein [Chitinophagales bacterium]
MKRKFFETILFAIYFCIASPYFSFGQNGEVWEPNLHSFSKKELSITNELISLSSTDAQTHPEFGLLPYNTPCDDCVELIDKRTFDSRYYIKNGTNGNEFYSQKSFGNFHYLDETGKMISYDPALSADDTEENVFAATHQETPTEIDIENKYSAFRVNGDEFQFNKNLHLKNITPAGEEIDLGIANWTNYTIGDNGARIINAWNGIDIEIIFDMHTIKSNFIITEPLEIEEGNLIITDDWNLPDGYNLNYDEGETDGNGWKGSLKVSSSNKDAYYFEISRAIIYDASASTENSVVGAYAYSLENATLDLIIPVEWLNDPSRIYPITIDPLVTSSATYTTGKIKFRHDGSFCPGPATDCAYTLTVPRPANSALTDAKFSASYVTSFGLCATSCYMSSAGFQIVGPCGTSPGSTFWWKCGLPSGDTTGTCSFVNLSIYSIVSCLTSICSGSITFTLKSSYCDACTINGNCPAGTAEPCTIMNSSTWSITLTGKNLETLGDATDGSGSNTTVGNCCGTSTLNPLPAYGIPPYTYSWNTGASTPTLTVNSCSNGIYTYTCTVTDACSIIRTATFTYSVTDCLLSNNLINFEGYLNDNSVNLEWGTASGSEYDYFIIERSNDGTQFNSIITVDALSENNNQVNYSVNDENPISGINYYRLKQVNLTGEISYSKIISVNTFSNTSILLYPNPAGDEIILEYTDPLQNNRYFHIEITDIAGKTIVTDSWNLGENNMKHLNIKQLSDGFYNIHVSGGIITMNYSFIKE